MNKARRAQIDSAIADLENIKSEIESILSDEQEYFDNMPESFQDGDKGQTAQQAIDSLDEALDNIGDIVASLEGAKG